VDVVLPCLSLSLSPLPQPFGSVPIAWAFVGWGGQLELDCIGVDDEWGVHRIRGERFVLMEVG